VCLWNFEGDPQKTANLLRLSPRDRLFTSLPEVLRYFSGISRRVRQNFRTNHTLSKVPAEASRLADLAKLLHIEPLCPFRSQNIIFVGSRGECLWRCGNVMAGRLCGGVKRRD